MSRERWRVVITDSEAMTGVAPVCPDEHVPGRAHDLTADTAGGELPRFDVYGVYDCCPGPHLECGSTIAARDVFELLNQHEVEVCS